MTALSPISQFRSKVQWYLDGNTPNFSSELSAELLVALRLLGVELSSSEILAAKEFSSFASELSVREVSNGGQLSVIVSKLIVLNSVRELELSKRRSFRDTVVQLILIAEHSGDLGFRQAVLELAQAIV